MIEAIKMKILMFFIFFLLIGAFFIISNEKIKMNSSENVNTFFEKYGDWMDDLAVNGKTVIGFIVKSEWLPDKEKAATGN